MQLKKSVVISNPEKLEKTKKSILETGAGNFFVLTDFDRTLTTAFVNGKSVPSLVSILRDSNYLTPDYAAKARLLWDKYHPFEINPKITLEEKEKTMEEWWMNHFELLIKSGLNKKDLKMVVESERVKHREGFSEFNELLIKYKIPLIIISASGLGGDNILMYLEKSHVPMTVIHIISNTYEWDENGNAVAIKRPIIHNMNKNGNLLKALPIFGEIKNRKNILLLGDSLDDIKMAENLDYDNLIKVGFLNEKVEENLELYKQSFDVIILNDSSLEYVNDLLKEVIL